MKRQPSGQETLHSMRVATRMTGLTADLIRKWEERYQAITPRRTSGNTRKFSAAEIERLKRLRDATAAGHAIKDVAQLDDEALARLGGPACAEAPREPGHGPIAAEDGESLPGRWQRAYLNEIRSFQARRANRVLARAAALLPTRDFLFELVLPLLGRIGQEWAAERLSPAQEHLASIQVRALLLTLLHGFDPLPGARRILVSTPEGHLHEMGALIAAVIAAERGFDPLYLGPHLPEADLESAARLARAEVLILSVVREVTTAELEGLAAAISRLSRKLPTWIGLPQDHALTRRRTGARHFHRFEELDLALADLGARVTPEPGPG